jgi:hypothetical protein
MKKGTVVCSYSVNYGGMDGYHEASEERWTICIEGKNPKDFKRVEEADNYLKKKDLEKRQAIDSRGFWKKFTDRMSSYRESSRYDLYDIPQAKREISGDYLWQNKEYEKAIGTWRDYLTGSRAKNFEEIKAKLEEIRKDITDEDYQGLDFTFQVDIKQDINEKIQQLKEQIDSVIKIFDEKNKKQVDKRYINSFFSDDKKQHEKDTKEEAYMDEENFHLLINRR